MRLQHEFMAQLSSREALARRRVKHGTFHFWMIPSHNFAENKLGQRFNSLYGASWHEQLEIGESCYPQLPECSVLCTCPSTLLAEEI